VEFTREFTAAAIPPQTQFRLNDEGEDFGTRNTSGMTHDEAGAPTKDSMAPRRSV
jgi:hypothetical protein